jgi:hypothetical protein
VSDDWIVIPGWDKFQVYKYRNPPKIFLHTELIHRDDWLDLSDAAKGLLTLIWLEYAAANGQLKVSRLPTGARQSYRRVSLEALNDAGFIELSARKPEGLRARARETETEAETDSSKSPHKKKPRGVTGWRLVKGSHGISHVPDPFGTDRPPADAPNVESLLKEMP